MKSKWYIVLAILIVILAFSYSNMYSFSTPSIKVSKIKNIHEDVLCFQINISSLDYIDSLIIEVNGENDESNKRIFKFEKNTRRASVIYYIKTNIHKDELIFLIKSKGYEKRIKIAA